jgi:hypothetical protein
MHGGHYCLTLGKVCVTLDIGILGLLSLSGTTINLPATSGRMIQTHTPLEWLYLQLLRDDHGVFVASTMMVVGMKPPMSCMQERWLIRYESVFSPNLLSLILR